MRTKIKAVFFDAGNTILFINFKIIKKILEEYGYKVSLTELKEAELKWRTSLEDNIEELKHLTDQEVLPHYFTEALRPLGIQKSDLEVIVQEIISRHRKKMLWSIFPSSVRKVIVELRKKGYKVGVISNSDGRLVNQLKSLKVYDLFDAVIDSREVGVEKPNPQIFEIAMKRLKVTPQESIYVGDLYSIDIIPAQKMGIRAILFDPGNHFPHLHCPRIQRLKDIFEHLE